MSSYEMKWKKIAGTVTLAGILVSGLVGCGSAKNDVMTIPSTIAGANGGSYSIAAKGIYDTSLVSKTTYLSRSQSATFLIDSGSGDIPEITFHSVGDVSGGSDLSGVARASAQVTSTTANGAIVVTFITECFSFGIFPFATKTAFRLDFAYTNNGDTFDPTQSRIDVRECGFSQGIPSPAQWLSWGNTSLYVRFGDVLGKR